MKKKVVAAMVIIIVFLILAVGVDFVGENFYNRTIIDLTYAYDTAIIKLPDGQIVKGKVDSWTDYADGDQIQVKINGKVYLVHSANVALIKE